MKSVSRIVDIVTLLVFLIALTSNCVQASQIASDWVVSCNLKITGVDTSKGDNFALIIADDESDDTPEADKFEFLIADDESEDTPRIVPIQTAISPIDPDFSLRTFFAPPVRIVNLTRPTVLRI